MDDATTSSPSPMGGNTDAGVEATAVANACADTIGDPDVRRPRNRLSSRRATLVHLDRCESGAWGHHGQAENAKSGKSRQVPVSPRLPAVLKMIEHDPAGNLIHQPRTSSATGSAGR